MKLVRDVQSILPKAEKRHKAPLPSILNLLITACTISHASESVYVANFYGYIAMSFNVSTIDMLSGSNMV